VSKAKPRPPVVPLHQMLPGQPADCYALLTEKVRGTTRDNKPYFTCTFQDKLRKVEAKIWQDSQAFPDCEEHWQPGQCFKIRGVFTEHERYGPQLDLQQVRLVNTEDNSDGFRSEDLYERSRFDSAKMLEELRDLAKTELADEPLRELVLKLLETHGDALQLLPAHPTRFFNFPGGWLEHILNVSRNALLLVDRYRIHYPDLKPPLNRDLVLAGAILHDIGRVVELQQVTPAAPAERTVPGVLFGHVLLGRDLVREAARDFPALNPQLLQLLEHVIHSHLVIPEWGSARQPAIPEVLILHHVDDLDAKLELYTRTLRLDLGDGPFTERDSPAGKQLLKQREV
jgi:3'-5' exoribonuclease